MDNTLRLLPDSSQLTSKQAGSNTEFGVHDTFRDGFRSVATEITKKHPLEGHLANWDKTQTELKYKMLRQTYGIDAPIRLQMEKMFVNQLHGVPVGPQHNLSLDILNGRDQTIEFEDFLGDYKMPMYSIDPHAAMEEYLSL
ncbi:proteasome maturation factor UMP1-domain-containing protein [Globomyces pollinis-pini]|nr:proteasome maturation factor UMP1-domain-containing protein [Globomyces pollinis-pini]